MSPHGQLRTEKGYQGHLCMTSTEVPGWWSAEQWENNLPMIATLTKVWVYLGTLENTFFQPMKCTTVTAPTAHLSKVELLVEVITFSLIWLKESTVIKCYFLLPWYTWPPMLHVLNRWRYVWRRG